jgi:hypothetical protein
MACMTRVTSRRTATNAAALQVRVLGPESSLPTAGDVRRLFSDRALTRARRERLLGLSKVVATVGPRLVGVALFERANDEIRVHELALEPDLCFSTHDILRQLLDALELACLASGGRRLVLLPSAVIAVSPLERLGYRVVSEGCAGAWLEKRFM